MAIFGKKGNKPSNKQKDTKKSVKKSSRKRGFHGKNKKEQTLIESLKIDAVAPSTISDDISVLAEQNDGYVARVDESGHVSATGQYFRVLVLTEDDLITNGLTADSDSMGELVALMRQSSIQNASTEDDLNNGHVVIIPSHDTLEFLKAMPEFKNGQFHVGRFPIDASDEDDEVLSIIDDSVVSYSEVVSNQEATVKNFDYDDDEDDDEDDDLESTSDSNVFEDDDELESEDLDVSSDSDDPFNFDSEDDDSSIDSDDSDLLIDDDIDDSLDFEGDLNFDSQDDMVETSDDEDYDDFERPTEEEIEQADSNDAEKINSIMNDSKLSPAQYIKKGWEARKLMYDESDLELSLEPDRFNSTFTSVPPVGFEVSDEKADDSLDASLNNLRKEANVRLNNQHYKSNQQLLQLYEDGAASISKFIRNKYSYSNPDGDFGKMKTAINENHDIGLEQSQEDIDSAIDNARDAYNRQRDAYLQSEYAKLEQSYDLQHKDELVREEKKARNEVIKDVENEFNNALSELEARRKADAADEFSQMINDLFAKLQDEYNRATVRETKMIDSVSTKLMNFHETYYVRDLQRVELLAKNKDAVEELNKVKLQFEDRLQNERLQYQHQLDALTSQLKASQVEKDVLRSDMKDIEAKVEKRYKAQIEAANETAQLAIRNANSYKEIARNPKASFNTSSGEKNGTVVKETLSNNDSIVDINDAKKSHVKTSTIVTGVVFATMLTGGAFGFSHLQSQSSKLKEVSSKQSELSHKYSQLQSSNIVLKQSVNDKTSEITKLEKELSNNSVELVKTTPLDSSNKKVLSIMKMTDYKQNDYIAGKIGNAYQIVKVLSVQDKTITVQVDGTSDKYKFTIN